MRNFRLASITIFFLLLLLILHVYSMHHYWYIRFPFLDLITHFLGGVGIALSAFYITKNPKYIIIITIIAGTAWEIFEVYFDITGWKFGTGAYYRDSIKDIIMDTIGACFVWFRIRNKK